MFVFFRHFYVFVRVVLCLRLMKLYNIWVLLNCANCLNFQNDKRNLDMAVSASSNRLFFYDLLIIIIFVGGRADHHY